MDTAGFVRLKRLLWFVLGVCVASTLIENWLALAGLAFMPWRYAINVAAMALFVGSIVYVVRRADAGGWTGTAVMIVGAMLLVMQVLGTSEAQWPVNLPGWTTDPRLQRLLLRPVTDGLVYLAGILLAYFYVNLAEKSAELLRREIQERQQTEQYLLDLRAQLAHCARLSAIGEMATALAHEINQPLAAITTYADSCLRLVEASDSSSRQLREPLVELARQATRAVEIVQRMRAFARKQPTRRSTVDLNRLIREVTQLVESEARHRGVTLRLDLAESLPEVLADSIQVQQVVLNLVRNAIEAVGETQHPLREVIVSTAYGSNALVVAVRDTGPGLNPEIAGQVFEPFVTTKPDGLGLGLSISRSIVESHGGRMRALPRADGGLTVQFTLPVQFEEPKT